MIQGMSAPEKLLIIEIIMINVKYLSITVVQKTIVQFDMWLSFSHVNAEIKCARSQSY